MSSSEVFETPGGGAIAQDLSPEGHLREYTYGEFEDDDLWDEDGPASCSSCGGNDERGYGDCEYGSLDCYVPGPDVLDEEGHLIHHGCPRVVGAF